MKILKQDGQSLVEVLIALVVVAVLASALIMSVITGMKNSQFAQKQTQATKYAQDAIDKVRTVRDRDGAVEYSGNTYATFSALWNISMSSDTASCPEGKCYYKVQDVADVLSLDQVASTDMENLGEGLSRQIIIEDTPGLLTEKNITVKVRWTDVTGDHESYLQTTLTQHL